MTEENISQEFRLKNIDETWNYLTEEINQNNLMRKYKEVLNYIQQLLTLVSTLTGYFSISDFASLVGIPIGIMSSAIGLKICVITTEIKKHKSFTKKKKKKHDKILSLAKSKLFSIKVVYSKASIDSKIIHDESVSINNLPKKFDDMKEGIKNSNDK